MRTIGPPAGAAAAVGGRQRMSLRDPARAARPSRGRKGRAMYGDYGHNGDWGWGGWLLMSLTMLAFLALVAWGVFLVWRSTTHPHHVDPAARPTGRQSPQEILAERFARGEIDAEEYRSRLEALGPG
jgi:putative membrane protein